MAAREITDLPAHLRLFAELAANPSRAATRGEVAEVDPAIYLSEERLARERATLFRHYPVIVAHESELPAPGSLLAVDHLGLPILLARGRDKKIRAFINACRHRNTKLVKGAATKASVVCPYHSWTYGLDGELLNIPCAEQFPGVEKADHGLVPLPCDTRCGLVFVVPDPQGAIDLTAHLAGLEPDFDAFGVGTSVVFRKVEQKKRTNWKLVIDAFQDGYHIQYLHRHSIAPFFKDSCSISDRAGNNIRSLVARGTFDDALKLPPSQWNIRAHATYSYFVFPNTTIVMHPDYISVLGLFPISTGETLYSHTLLTPHAPQSDKERDHYERSFDLIENGVFQAEDLEVCERAQAALEGGATWPMTLGALEVSVKLAHDIMDEAMARG